ncbi:MAG: hypothetical protein IT336_07700 [Thermomicrobiales bacterium]|nr:hypothetical protein [Thermomicrobiales bacterium]
MPSRRVLLLNGLTVTTAILIGRVAKATPVARPTATTIDPVNFIGAIDNPFLPLVPGTRFIYEGSADGVPTRVETTVTGETRTIMGIRCVVVLDLAYEDGELIEETRDWYAQDVAGNVWYFGEASQDIEDGEVVDTHGSWEAGVDGAQPGIIMPANPAIGVPYAQELAPGIAEDMAEVARIGDDVTVPYGAFGDVLVIREWNPLDPGVIEEKFYAPGVGLIREVAIEGEDEHLDLIDVQVLVATPPA